jgi:hypothetical protein
MLNKLFKRNKKEMVMVTFKHEREENACTEIMDKKALANIVVNDPYTEIIKVVEL